VSPVISSSFEEIALSDLAAMGCGETDELPHSVIALDRNGIVAVYNAAEARLAGLDAQAVIGVPFFDAVAQCMNNFMVAQRFEDEPEIDDIIPMC